MKENDIKQFQAELKELIEKYNVIISFSCKEYSDLSGIYGGKIVIKDNKTKEEILSFDDWYINKSNIDDYE